MVNNKTFGKLNNLSKRLHIVGKAIFSGILAFQSDLITRETILQAVNSIERSQTAPELSQPLFL